MENGPVGVSGLHVMPPVVEEFIKEAGSVTTRHPNMVEIPAWVSALKLRNVMKNHALVSPLASNIYIKYCSLL